MDVTEHPTGDGKAYPAVVLDAFSRRVVGWSIADHIRSELFVDALQMALWRRRPAAGTTVAHSDHGSQGEISRLSHTSRGRPVREDQQAPAPAGDPCDARKMWSPGRPSTARREDRVRFWNVLRGARGGRDPACPEAWCP
jgi:transposase InsO family protein